MSANTADLPSRISAGSTNHSQLLLAFRLAGVPPFKEVGERLAQELKRDILESPSRSMPEFEHILFVASLAKGRRHWVPERRIRFINNGLQVL
jgi:hypothetical protein